MTRFAVLAVLVLAGCDSTTAPEYPDVAGNYTGSLTVTTDGERFTGQMSMFVVQHDDGLTITGSIDILGESFHLPAITGRISKTGFFTLTAGGVATATSDPECGTVTAAAFTLTFVDDTARLHESSTSTHCGTFAYDAQLTRR